MAEGLDERMGRCILSLYRSAVQPAMRILGDQVADAERRPGMLIHATDDPFVPPAMAFDVAARTGARILTLPGLQHWWMFEDPQAAARGLVDFWATAG